MEQYVQSAAISFPAQFIQEVRGAPCLIYLSSFCNKNGKFSLSLFTVCHNIEVFDTFGFLCGLCLSEHFDIRISFFLSYTKIQRK